MKRGRTYSTCHEFVSVLYKLRITGDIAWILFCSWGSDDE